jgi:hypothetical protein
MINENGIFGNLVNFIEKTFKVNFKSGVSDQELYDSFQLMCINKG